MKYVFISPGAPTKVGKGYQKILHERFINLESGSRVLLVICYPFFGAVPVLDDVGGQYDHLDLEVLIVRPSIFDFFAVPLRILLGYPIQVILHQRFSIDSLLADISHSSPGAKIYCLMSRTFHKNVSLFERTLLDFVDSMELNFKRRSAQETNYFKSKVFEIEAVRMKKWDKKCLSMVREAIVVSQLDAQHISPERIRVVPIGIDKYEGEILSLARRNGNIVFSGNMNYWPNLEAVQFFIEECWPKIKHVNKNVEFHIVGRGLSEQLAACFSKVARVKCIGEVDDMQATLAKYPISIAPMQSGSGMQFKIIEALSVGCMVISSELAASSLQYKDDSVLCVVQKPGDYAEKALEILRNFELRENIALKAANFASINFGWWSAQNVLSDLMWYKE